MVTSLGEKTKYIFFQEKKKTIFGHIKIINLFLSCKEHWYESKLLKNLNRTPSDPTRKWNTTRQEREKEKGKRGTKEDHFTYVHALWHVRLVPDSFCFRLRQK